MHAEREWERINECLQKAAVQTFEMMCFADAAPAGEKTSARPEGLTVRRIEFNGDATGRLFLAIDMETARLLASNFYGQDPDSLPESQVEAMVGELTNVVCGGMLSLYAPHGSFQLSAPHMDQGWDADPRSLRRAFRVESGRVLVSIACDGPLFQASKDTAGCDATAYPRTDR